MTYHKIYQITPEGRLVHPTISVRYGDSFCDDYTYETYEDAKERVYSCDYGSCVILPFVDSNYPEKD